jgi:triosephosphate isomerase (TIM)
MLRLPILIINFKNYKNAIGKKALELAKIIEEVSKETNIEIAIAVSPLDAQKLKENTTLPILAQHTDSTGYGSHTGNILPELLKEIGIEGSLINHSEKRIPREYIEEIIPRLKENGLISIVCAKDALEAEDLSLLGPDMIAVEPPELISGNISVSTANPELIKESVDKINHHQKCGIILVGAGVKNKEDVRIALQLGAKGILLASGITKAENPKQVLQDLLQGFRFN